MKLNDDQQENLADRLAEAVVQHWLAKAKEDLPAAVSEGRYLLDHLETYPVFLRRDHFKDRKSLSRQLVGLQSFLQAVQRDPSRVMKWDDLEESPEKNSLAEDLWSRERLH
ncbi:MAG: hypothetical protein FJ398_11145 [Verrucomicrobia bacterium]|nr:hypothetical protein [Verrucomicrobiota bacterium]